MDRLPSAKIRDSLEQRIVEGELGNGKRLDETELSGFYGVSRTPVREALQRLAESGLAEHLPRRGTFVRSPSLSQLVEMFEVMAELECMAIRLAARRATSNDIDALEKDNETCRAAVAANDTKKYYEINARLHGRIYQMSGNSFLANEARRLHDRLRPFRRLQLRVRGRMEESMAEHDIILAALRDGDAGRAMETMKKHITIVGVRFNDLVSSFNRIMGDR
ncbi:GntR family transcriptional regulator [Alphaproteobacteria bacterium]|nr:GntR family transcriptional regulator [Alphaproteobacteria bacterium]MDB9890605.1 GntR family transcriptional regulator [Alphaproteobacteria bacterium]MDC0459028.1 GntR family transcriptional regulator [Alphaproteobacteria bacterium]MDC0607065.1 GntR family transcriptional regulator [bacterium]MDC1117432.1 GntR family transcriptional regulator [Alphaproteobacteria bacterium]